MLESRKELHFALKGHLRTTSCSYEMLSKLLTTQVTPNLHSLRYV